jgi:predicted metal-dependent phosphoesterase TrpH
MRNFKVEFHCHTVYSKDSLVRPADLIKTARQKGLDRVIVTDHNSIAGAQLAQSLDPELVIVGEEVRTPCGEFLAAFVTELVPKGLPPMEALRRLRDQGAFISVSHPFDKSRGWKLEDLLEILPYVDAIESFNSRCMEAVYNTEAQEFAQKNNLAITVGSDAHALFEVGRSHLELPGFNSADDLRAVIRQGNPVTYLSSPFVHTTSMFAKIAKHFKPSLHPTLT